MAYSPSLGYWLNKYGWARTLFTRRSARTLEEAILWHGGEAQSSRDAYADLSSSDRALILGFLKAL